MKKLGFFFLLFFPILTYCCDHCNVYLNINPNDDKHSFGVQYRSRLHYGKFSSTGTLMLKHGGSNETVSFRDNEVWEKYNRVEFTGRYFINEKWSIQGVLPYINNQQIIDSKAKYNVTGIGDPMILQNYQIFNTKALKDSIVYTHRLTIGMGVKMPLGSFDREYPAGTPNIDLQAGTGSWDGLFNLTYLAKVKNFVLVYNLNYKLNSQNKDDFQYGNTLNGLFNINYQVKIKNHVIMPSVGFYTEIAASDKMAGVKNEISGDQLYFGDVSLNWYLKRIRVQANYQPNIASILKDDKQLITKNKLNFSLTYNI